ncbi:MAG: DUF433 domain-containing protein [Bryobacteraceae bacterium]
MKYGYARVSTDVSKLVLCDTRRKPKRSLSFRAFRPPCSRKKIIRDARRPTAIKDYHDKEGKNMANLDWSQCPAVESIPGKVSGAWVFKDTRMPISVIFENLEYGSSVEEIMENYNVTREQIQVVLEFAARSAAAPPAPVGAVSTVDAHTL